MTKGRRPLSAIREAIGIAGRRGYVVNVSGSRSIAFDLIIIEKLRVVFVKVKRSQTSFTYLVELLRTYPREIASLHRISPTGVTVREFWVRSPSGEWQYFQIREESVIEIQADGRVIPRESISPEIVDPSGMRAEGAGDPVSPTDNEV